MLPLSVDFLRALAANNHKEWFDAHRDQYQKAKDEYEHFVNLLIDRIRAFDPTIGQVTAKDCTYRIYRDIRFSPDKTPYKNYFGAYIAQGGRKSMLGGYYFHVEPTADAGYLGHSMWAGGIYAPDPATLKAIRTDIYEHTEEYKKIISDAGFASAFRWFEGGILRTAPKGFPKDFADMKLIQRKDYTFSKNIDEKMLRSDQLLDKSIEVFRLMLPFNQFMNRAILFHQEQAD